MYKNCNLDSKNDIFSNKSWCQIQNKIAEKNANPLNFSPVRKIKNTKHKILTMLAM